MPFGIPEYEQCMLHGLTFVSNLSLLTAQGVEFLIAPHDGFPTSVTGIVQVTGLIAEILPVVFFVCDTG